MFRLNFMESCSLRHSMASETSMIQHPTTENRSRTVTVPGVTGTIGSHLVRALLVRGERVITNGKHGMA